MKNQNWQISCCAVSADVSVCVFVFVNNQHFTCKTKSHHFELNWKKNHSHTPSLCKVSRFLLAAAVKAVNESNWSITKTATIAHWIRSIDFPMNIRNIQNIWYAPRRKHFAKAPVICTMYVWRETWVTVVYVINNFIVDWKPPHANTFGWECYWSYRCSLAMSLLCTISITRHKKFIILYSQLNEQKKNLIRAYTVTQYRQQSTHVCKW